MPDPNLRKFWSLSSTASIAQAQAPCQPATPNLLQRSTTACKNKKAPAVKRGLGCLASAVQGWIARFLFMAIMPLTMR